MVADKHWHGGGGEYGKIILNPGKLGGSNSRASDEVLSRLTDDLGLENSLRTIEQNVSLMVELGPILDKLQKEKTPIRVGKKYLTVVEVDTKKNQVKMSDDKYYSVYAECFDDLLEE